jgi:hypothetical protein
MARYAPGTAQYAAAAAHAATLAAAAAGAGGQQLPPQQQQQHLHQQFAADGTPIAQKGPAPGVPSESPGLDDFAHMNMIADLLE